MRGALLVLLVAGVANAAPRVDPRVVGTWEMTVVKPPLAWTVDLSVAPDGAYRIHTTGAATNPDDIGTVGAHDGAWQMQKSSGGPIARGRYTLADADTMTLTIGAGAVTWHRAAQALVVDPVQALYERGRGFVDANRYRESLPLLTVAAGAGLATAQNLLGFVLQEGGHGVPKDAPAAAHWFGEAAGQGNRAAQYALGGMIEEGEGGLAKDPRRAAALYEASAKQGFAKAQFAYGLSCEFVLDDRPQAIRYLDLAGAQGEGMARWTAAFLRRPGTPHFTDETQLASYMNAQVAAWLAASAPKSDTTISKYYEERWRMFYSQGNEAAGDRCKYNGMCY